MSCCGRRSTRCGPSRRRPQLPTVDERTEQVYSLQRISSVSETEMYTAREDGLSSRDDDASVTTFGNPTDLHILLTLRQKMETMRTYILDPKKEFISAGTVGKIPIFFRKFDNHPLVARGEVFVPNVTSLETIAAAISSDERHNWDTDVIEMRKIRDILVAIPSPDFFHENVSQVYNSFKGRFGFPGRDFVWNTYIAFSETDLVQLCYSTGDPAEASNQKFVRAETILSGYWVRLIQGGCMIHFINQTDIKGRLPDWIVDSVVKKSPAKLEQLYTYLIGRT